MSWRGRGEAGSRGGRVVSEGGGGEVSVQKLCVGILTAGGN